AFTWWVTTVLSTLSGSIILTGPLPGAVYSAMVRVTSTYIPVLKVFTPLASKRLPRLMGQAPVLSRSIPSTGHPFGVAPVLAMRLESQEIPRLYTSWEQFRLPQVSLTDLY